jgi:hypothetical protein
LKWFIAHLNSYYADKIYQIVYASCVSNEGNGATPSIRTQCTFCKCQLTLAGVALIYKRESFFCLSNSQATETNVCQKRSELGQVNTLNG